MSVDLLTARNVKTNKYLSIKVKIRKDAPQDAHWVGLLQTMIGKIVRYKSLSLKLIKM